MRRSPRAGTRGLLSALSAAFPLSETFFIDSAGRFRADLDLGGTIVAFVVREAQATRCRMTITDHASHIGKTAVRACAAAGAR